MSVTLPGGPVQQLTVAASVLPSADGTYEMFLSPVWKLEDDSMQQVRAGRLVGVEGKKNCRGSVQQVGEWRVVTSQNRPYLNKFPTDFKKKITDDVKLLYEKACQVSRR